MFCRGFGFEVVESTDTDFHIKAINGKLIFTALLEEIEDDGFTSFRIGDSLITRITNGRPLNKYSYVCFPRKSCSF